MNTTHNTHESHRDSNDFDNHISTSDILLVAGLAGFGMLCPIVCICGINYYRKHHITSDIEDQLI